ASPRSGVAPARISGPTPHREEASLTRWHFGQSGRLPRAELMPQQEVRIENQGQQSCSRQQYLSSKGQKVQPGTSQPPVTNRSHKRGRAATPEAAQSHCPGANLRGQRQGAPNLERSAVDLSPRGGGVGGAGADGARASPATGRCADRRSAWPTIHAQSVAMATIIRRRLTPNKSELSAEKTEAGDDDDGADDEDGGGCSHRLDFNEVGEAGTIGSVVSDLHDALHAFDDKDYQVLKAGATIAGYEEASDFLNVLDGGGEIKKLFEAERYLELLGKLIKLIPPTGEPEIDIPLGVLKTLEIVHMQHAWEAFGKGEYRLALSEIGDAVMPQSMEQMVRNARPSTVAPGSTGALVA
uniref:RPN1_RPN2_N domain-containing protein n=1 Tax=Macrostomum lignano TaxID=282301 RepID=A0A1I8FLB4_9PLAT